MCKNSSSTQASGNHGLPISSLSVSLKLPQKTSQLTPESTGSTGKSSNPLSAMPKPSVEKFSTSPIKDNKEYNSLPDHPGYKRCTLSHQDIHHKDWNGYTVDNEWCLDNGTDCESPSDCPENYFCANKDYFEKLPNNKKERNPKTDSWYQTKHYGKNVSEFQWNNRCWKKHGYGMQCGSGYAPWSTGPSSICHMKFHDVCQDHTRGCFASSSCTDGNNAWCCCGGNLH